MTARTQACMRAHLWRRSCAPRARGRKVLGVQPTALWARHLSASDHDVSVRSWVQRRMRTWQ